MIDDDWLQDKCLSCSHSSSISSHLILSHDFHHREVPDIPGVTDVTDSTDSIDSIYANDVIDATIPASLHHYPIYVLTDERWFLDLGAVRIMPHALERIGVTSTEGLGSMKFVFVNFCLFAFCLTYARAGTKY